MAWVGLLKTLLRDDVYSNEITKRRCCRAFCGGLGGLWERSPWAGVGVREPCPGSCRWQTFAVHCHGSSRSDHLSLRQTQIDPATQIVTAALKTGNSVGSISSWGWTSSDVDGHRYGYKDSFKQFFFPLHHPARAAEVPHRAVVSETSTVSCGTTPRLSMK